MYKVIALLKAKPGMSKDDFIEYYENKHAPLIRRHMPLIVDYRRNYVQPDTTFFLTDNAQKLDFDVVTEFSFNSREDFDTAYSIFNDPSVTSEITDDEDMFLDRGKTRLFVVEEYMSKIK